jgi:hypothetical protein
LESLHFHQAVQLVELAWLKREHCARRRRFARKAENVIRAAAILACSDQPSLGETAFRVATCVYELVGSAELPMDPALRVVLSRLGNFPSLATTSMRRCRSYRSVQLRKFVSRISHDRQSPPVCNKLLHEPLEPLRLSGARLHMFSSSTRPTSGDKQQVIAADTFQD